jgi:hypothetical protein
MFAMSTHVRKTSCAINNVSYETLCQCAISNTNPNVRSGTLCCILINIYIPLTLLVELDGAVSALRRVIAEVKQCWLVIGWVTKNLLSRAPPCFGRHVKPLVPAVFEVVGTHKPVLGSPGGL